jgi:hypothetical protein
MRRRPGLGKRGIAVLGATAVAASLLLAPSTAAAEEVAGPIITRVIGTPGAFTGPAPDGTLAEELPTGTSSSWGLLGASNGDDLVVFRQADRTLYKIVDGRTVRIAASSNLPAARKMALGSDGAVWLLWSQLWRVGPDGVVSSVTAPGAMTQFIDGMLASELALGQFQTVTVDGNVPVVSVDPSDAAGPGIVRIEDGVARLVGALPNSDGVVLGLDTHPEGGYVAYTIGNSQQGAAPALVRMALNGEVVSRQPRPRYSENLAVDEVGSVLSHSGLFGGGLLRHSVGAFDIEAMVFPNGDQLPAPGVAVADTSIRTTTTLFTHQGQIVTGARPSKTSVGSSMLVAIDRFVADPFDPAIDITTSRAPGSDRLTLSWATSCAPGCSSLSVGPSTGPTLDEQAHYPRSGTSFSNGTLTYPLGKTPELSQRLVVSVVASSGAYSGRILDTPGTTSIPATLPKPTLAPVAGAVGGYVKPGKAIRFLTTPALPTECKFSADTTWTRCIDGAFTMQADRGSVMARVAVDGRVGPTYVASLKADGSVNRPHIRSSGKGSLDDALRFDFIATDDGVGVSHSQVRTMWIDRDMNIPKVWSYPGALKHVKSSSFSLSASPGVTRCASVRTFDKLGNVSSWSEPKCRTRLWDDRSISRAGPWDPRTSPSTYNDTYLHTVSRDATLTIRNVRQDYVLVRTRLCPRCGQINIEFAGNRTSENLRYRTLKTGVIVKVPVPRWNGKTGAGTVRLSFTGIGEGYGSNVVDGVALHTDWTKVANIR